MPFPLILAAAALSAPLPIERSLLGTQDYPTNALERNISAAALVELVISPRGKVENCTLLASRGDEKLAATMCGLIKNRKWAAAIGPDGLPAYGVVRTLLRFFIPDTAIGDQIGAMAQRPDIELAVNRLPITGVKFFDVKVSLLVNRNGSVVACEPRITPAAQRQLGILGCEQAKKMQVTAPIVTGAPLTTFVIEQKIRFVQQVL